MAKEIDIIRNKELLKALEARRINYYTLLSRSRDIAGNCSLCETYLEPFGQGYRHCSQCPAGEKICEKFVKKRQKIDKELREMVRYLDVQIRKVKLWLQVQS